MMNVLVISGQPPLTTSGIAAWDFHTNLLQHGDSSKFLTLQYESEDPSIISYFSSETAKFLFLVKRRLFRKRISRVDKTYYYNGETLIPPFVSTRTIIQKLQGFKPDVIVIFFEKRFITAQTLHELYRETGAPVYWYLMDMQPMTGGCAYAQACTGYQRQCGRCPAIYSNDPNDITARNLETARFYYDKTDLTIIAASEQLRNQASASTLFKNKRIVKIPLGINERLFKPLEEEQRRTVRVQYGLPVDKKLIFLGAVSLSEKRKGAAFLLDAFQQLCQADQGKSAIEKAAIVIAGNSGQQLKSQLEQLTDFALPIYVLGFLSTYEALGEVLGASDIFVSASIEDAGPMMVNQAVMCGTPVVAFNIGVAQDLVLDDISGVNAGTISSQQLAEGITHLLRIPPKQFSELREKTATLGHRSCALGTNYQAFKKLLTSETKCLS
ncbi:MAG: glycosyltransferase [Spirosomataceae bacterium]